MANDNRTLDRRRYLQLTGVTGVTAIGLAGCLEDTGDGGDGEDGGDGNETDSEDGNETDGNETDSEDGNETDGNETDGNETDGEDGGDGGDDMQIVAGTAPGFPPFEMTEDGDLVGFDVDLLEAVVEETDYELTEWQEFDFDTLIQALQSGNIDVIAAAMTITEERQEQIAFSDPYYSADQSVLVAEGGDFQPGSLEDLDGRTVGAQSGTTGEEVVQNDLIDEGVIGEGDYTSYDNYVLAVEDLERGLIDAVILDQPVGQTFESNRDVEVAFTFETGEEYGFGVRQDDGDLQSALSEGIAAVEESGEYDEITEKWFASDE
ncbi:basic amino acid ABC transporter substrate-binding protein [Salinilacihabitans rarus]|uniref:basic amino acid ABC transporter substrate-binding protein n=1 Tax=Salinilacihabitans rarus TaxID=2961596 RepID=UPI0020C8B049|nr:basic amino acid ABC transporter substrate-binding protein [Salinilacihabitans rarus]